MRIGLPETASACKVSMPLFGNLVPLLLQFFYAHELLTEKGFSPPQAAVP